MKKSISWSLVGVVITVGVVYVIVAFNMIDAPGMPIPQEHQAPVARKVQNFKELFDLLEQQKITQVRRPDVQNWKRLFSLYTSHQGVPYMLEAQALELDDSKKSALQMYVLYNGSTEATMRWYGPFVYSESLVSEVKKLKKGQKIGQASIVQSVDIPALSR